MGDEASAFVPFVGQECEGEYRDGSTWRGKFSASRELAQHDEAILLTARGEHYVLRATLRPASGQPAPVPPTESEFKVGERVRGVSFVLDKELSGVVELLRSECAGRCGVLIRVHSDDALHGFAYTLDPTTVRRLTASTPEATATEAKCPRCGSTDLSVHDDKCNGCGVTGKELRVAKATEAPVAKPDPYAEHREHLRLAYGAIDDARVERLTDCQPRRAKFTADQIGSIDLDRPLTPPRYPSRSYVCIGIMGDGAPVKRRGVKGAPSTWPEGSDHE